MNGNLNLSVDPLKLEEKGDAILAQYKVIKEAIEEIKEAKQGLSTWQSENKDRYEAKLNEALPKMEEMADAIASYGNVAKITSQSVINTERIIARNIDMNGSARG